MPPSPSSPIKPEFQPCTATWSVSQTVHPSVPLTPPQDWLPSSPRACLPAPHNKPFSHCLLGASLLSRCVTS
jgi:hypothetical protein